jgi:amino acid adenylation domain-containing protein
MEVMSRDWHNQPAVLHQLVRAQARRTPNRIAAVFEDRWTTYGELVARSGGWADHLRRLGVEVGTRVGLYLEHSLELPITILAILEAGGICVPMEPSDPPQRVAEIIRETEPLVILTQRRLQTELPTTTVPIVIADEEIPEDAPAPGVAVTPDDLAFILMTSGSTGVPKGVMVSHATVAARMFREEADLPDEGRCLAILKTPIGNSPFLGEIFAPLLHGCYFVIARPGGNQDIPYLGSLIIEHGVTHIAMTSAVLRAFLEWPEAARCRSLKAVYCGGEVVSDGLRDRFRECFGEARCVVTYGTTEAGHSLTCECGDGERLDGARIGRAITNAEVHFLDPALEPVPAGEVGEIYLGGARLATGYWNRPAWTAERFVPHPSPPHPGARLYRSGDLGRLRPDGDLEFRGRVDDMVKVRGNRVELPEIEAALTACPGVREAVVQARPTDQGDAQLVAYIVPERRPAPAVHELRRRLAERLPPFMVPQAFLMLEALPLTPAGKVNRRALPQPDNSRPDLETAYIPARSPTEERLARIWCELLGLNRVGIRDDFYELGGHSLLVWRLWSQVTASFRMDYPLNLFRRHRTIEQLAASIEEREAAVSSFSDRKAPAWEDSRKPRLFFISIEALLAECLDDLPVYPLGFFTDEFLISGLESVEEIAAALIKRLREVQPTGQYRLGGGCGSAVIAFEMARQLRQQDEDVPLLMLIRPGGGDPDRAARLPSMVVRYSMVRLRHHLATLARLSPRSWAKYCAARVATILRVVGLIPFNRDGKVFWKRRPWLHKAVLSYKLGMYPGKVTLLLPGQVYAVDPESYHRWYRVAGGGLDLRIIPGTFESIGQWPGIVVLAEEIKALYTQSLPDNHLLKT